MTDSFEPIPPSQLFRTLLLHMIETQCLLTPIALNTTSRAIKLCHQQNAYMLSEIEFWLEGLTEDLDLTPCLSPVQTAELRAGVALSLKVPLPSGEVTIPVARAVPQVPRRGSRRARLSQRVASMLPDLERTSDGKIVFLPQSSNAKPDST